MKKDEIKAVVFTALFILSVVVGFAAIGIYSVHSEEDEMLIYEQQHLYWKNVPCEVKSIKSGVTFNMQVANSAYNVERTFRLWGSDAEEFADVKVGDIIWCKMYSWVVEDNDGQVNVVNRTLEIIKE